MKYADEMVKLDEGDGQRQNKVRDYFVAHSPFQQLPDHVGEKSQFLWQ